MIFFNEEELSSNKNTEFKKYLISHMQDIITNDLYATEDDATRHLRISQYNANNYGYPILNKDKFVNGDTDSLYIGSINYKACGDKTEDIKNNWNAFMHICHDKFNIDYNKYILKFVGYQRWSDDKCSWIHLWIFEDDTKLED